MIRRYQPKQFRKPEPKIVANSRIHASQVKVIGDDGKLLGVYQTSEALRLAYSQDKDLVLINANQQPPITKIIEINKYKYQLQQKEAQSRKNAKAQEIKEVRFTPFMSDGDYQSKLKKVKEFIADGHKVRLSLAFKGREITKQSFGFDRINQVINDTADITNLEIAPKMMGRKIIAQLMPKK